MPLAGPDTDLAAALLALWERRSGAFIRRADVIESALRELRSGSLAEPLREEAEREAHKLAGALGTFGLPAGSELARELEEGLAPGRLSHELVPRLAETLLALQREIARGPAVPAPARAKVGPREPDTGLDLPTSIMLVTSDGELAGRLSAQATARGLMMHTAEDAVAALAQVRRDPPAAVLVDLGADEADGARLDLLERLAEDTSAPAFALGTDDSLRGRLKLIARSDAGFLHRATSAAALLSTVAARFEQRGTIGAEVLALDDDPEILAALDTLLRPAGIEVTGLHDPERLWEMLEETTPDLVILDIDMPGVSGIDLCRVVRNDPRYHDLSVLFLSAHTDPETVRRLFASGADDFVAKPIVPAELVGRIRNRIQRARLLRELAEQDTLTGVPNRRKASVDLARLLLLLADRYEHPLSVAILDIDHFKAINDLHGHAHGDSVLRMLGKLLLQWFRGEDVVGRWGGEEFMLGLYGMGSDDGVRGIEALLDAFRALELPGEEGVPLRLTFSAGVAEYRTDAQDLQGLYRAADEALYRAKQSGRARVLPAG